MKYIAYLAILILVLFLSYSCEMKYQIKGNQNFQSSILFTEGYRWEMTEHYEGYYPDFSSDEENFFQVEIFDTTIYYYAYDSIINYEYRDTSYSHLYHYFKYNISGIMYNKTTGEESIREDFGDIGLFLVDKDEKAIYWKPSYGFFELYNFNVEIGDTIEHYVAYVKVIEDISFVRIGQYRLKRFHYISKTPDGFISDTGSYVEGIGTLTGLLQRQGKLEYFVIDGIKYTPNEIILEDKKTTDNNKMRTIIN